MNKLKNQVNQKNRHISQKMPKEKANKYPTSGKKKSLSPKSKAKQIEKNFGRFARAFVLLRSKERLSASKRQSKAPDESSPLSSVRSELDLSVKSGRIERDLQKDYTKVVSFDSRKSGHTFKSIELRHHWSTPRNVRESMPICYRFKKWPYVLVPRDKDFKTQDPENFNEIIDSLSLKSALSMETLARSDTRLGFSSTTHDERKSIESISTDHKPIEEKLESPIPKETWPQLTLGEQATFLRNGPSCPDVYEKSRNVIDKDELPLPDPLLESAHLDYALIMNMLDGNWGTDEDQTIAQITFKYIHDETFRKRLARECHSLIDECDCPLHDKITYEKLMKLDESSFYEIETEEDKKQVVDRLRKEFRERYEDDMNMDMERVINPEPDSDEDDDYYVEGFKRDEIKMPEITDFQDPKAWLNLEQPERDLEPKCCDLAHSEEALLNRKGYPDRPRIKIDRLRMKDMVKVRDRKNIEEVVEKMYQDKVHQFRVDEFKGIKWKPKKIYAYKRPDWRRPNSKKRDSYVEQEENTEE